MKTRSTPSAPDSPGLARERHGQLPPHQRHGQGDVVCVRLEHTRLEETEIAQLGDEVLSLCREGGWRKLAMSLGPETPYCLYSVFLAKLVAIRNALGKLGGQM